MWKRVLPISSFLLFLILTIPAIIAQGEVEILSHSSYIDPFGNYHVVGEIQNIGSFSLTSFKVTAKFYDSTSVYIDEDFAYLMLEILPPGYKAPFHIVYINTDKVPKIKSYTLETEYDQTSKLPSVQLNFKTQDSYVDEDGWMHITGTIENSGADTRFVEVTATCYDEDGGVTSVEYSFANPRDIQSGHTGSFEILIPYKVELIKDYVLLSQSEDYISIREFPFQIAFIIFSLAILLTYSAFFASKTRKNI